MRRVTTPSVFTQDPQPLGGIVTVIIIASLALKIEFTNFLLCIKSHSNLDEMRHLLILLDELGLRRQNGYKPT